MPVVKIVRNLALLSAAGALCLSVTAKDSSQVPKLKSLRIVVPLPAGSAPDVLARKISENLGKSLGIPVIVENKPGFSGFIGGQEVLRSPADGSSLYMAISSFVVITPQTYSKIPYDPVRDFRPLVQIGRTPLALAVSTSGRFSSLDSYVGEARKTPELVSFGSFGNGTAAHLLGEEFMRAGKIKLRHVPYKQSATPDVIGGHLDATITDVGSLTPFIGDPPKLRVLAVTGDKRNSLLPDVPTFAEQGYDSVSKMMGWLGVFAPKNIPPAMAEKLSQAIIQATEPVQYRASMAMLGYQYSGIQGAQFSDIVNADYKRWGETINAIGGIRLD